MRVLARKLFPLRERGDPAIIHDDEYVAAQKELIQAIVACFSTASVEDNEIFGNNIFAEKNG